MTTAGKRVLIVDDEAPIREMIAVALEMAGYQCLEAENVQEAHSIVVDPAQFKLLTCKKQKTECHRL